MLTHRSLSSSACNPGPFCGVFRFNELMRKKVAGALHIKVHPLRPFGHLGVEPVHRHKGRHNTPHSVSLLNYICLRAAALLRQAELRSCTCMQQLECWSGTGLFMCFPPPPSSPRRPTGISRTVFAVVSTLLATCRHFTDTDGVTMCAIYSLNGKGPFEQYNLTLARVCNFVQNLQFCTHAMMGEQH